MLQAISKKLNQYSFYITAAAVLLVFIYLGYFIYYYYFSTIIAIPQVIDLHREVPAENLDINKFDQAISSIEDKKKISASSTDDLINLFTY